MSDTLGGGVQLQTGCQAPKKKQSKSLAARGPTALPKNRGTGFEGWLKFPMVTIVAVDPGAKFSCTDPLGEYYAEPPLAPDEFKEESELYHPSVSFDRSVELRDLASCSEERLLMGVDVVDNFLRYIQIHDVCPEYETDVRQARVVCDRAKTELMSCRYAQTAMPGQFNIACVKLFYNEPTHKAFNDGLDPLDKVPKDCDAEAIFQTTVALQPRLAGNKTIEMSKDVKSIHILTTREIDLEISGLVLPSDETVQRYSAAGSPRCPILPAGVVVAKHHNIDEGYANQPRPSAVELAGRGNEAFFLDRELMALLCPGTKLRVVVHELNCDLNFISTVKDVHPSFYTFLPQELMMEWKEPRENDREAPSVDNPDAEDEAVQKMADEEKD
ncbi:hypothetical protein CMQ_4037 [Grosmannia clavigera kw1407]|uniref:Uncharacterized protein n=1 Tax=Grosmannia clavigera (strain kw1407 / UAMH 11150) TaxID=655863 RepID=F0X8B7_GROCL|nr:uncharacterized protein CMQ_4037 [Grosmannia clavigera kw1407]EFX05968.1 hypothetical protein CMQ_4037 [Grosmannia clavigera kw1407]